MRRAVLILGLSLALVAPAGAQTDKPPARTQVPPTATPRKTEPAPEPPPVPVLAPPPVSSPPAYDAGQCRLSCAQSYYFCLSSDTPDDCPGAWSQCRAACDAPSVVPSP